MWADQWVGWWVELSSHTVWLEAENSCGDKVDIISPSCDNWISFDGLARNPCSSQTLLEPLPRLGECELLVTLVKAISDERVFSIAIAISACLLLFGVSPIIILADWALGSVETQLSESLSRVELIWVGCKLWFGQVLDLFSGQALHCCFFFCHLENLFWLRIRKVSKNLLFYKKCVRLYFELILSKYINRLNTSIEFL